MKETTRPFGGRKKRDHLPGERVPLSFRVTPELKARLDAIAQKNGRSISQEMEMRLEESFNAGPDLAAALSVAYGDRSAGLALLVGQTLHDAGVNAAEKVPDASRGGWLDNPYSFDQAAQAAVAVLEAARPKGKIEVPSASEIFGKDVASSTIAKALIERSGTMLARAQIIYMNSDAGRADSWMAAIRRLLGPLAAKISRDLKG